MGDQFFTSIFPDIPQELIFDGLENICSRDAKIIIDLANNKEEDFINIEYRMCSEINDINNKKVVNGIITNINKKKSLCPSDIAISKIYNRLLAEKSL